MRATGRGFLSFCLTLLLLLLLFYGAKRYPVSSPEVKEENGEEAEHPLSEEEASLGYEKAEKELLLWTADAETEAFLKQAALDYYKETGIAVEVELIDPAFYLERIYEAELSEEEKAPDLYLTGGDVLEEAVLLGLAGENDLLSADLSGMAETAVNASVLRGKSYGYPVCFDTPVFVYLKEAIPEPPSTLGGIIKQATEEGLNIEVGNIVEWDPGDEFYDLSFLADCYSFSDETEGTLSVETDEALLQKKMDFLTELSDVITLDENAVSEGAVLNHLNHLATASAILDSDDLSKLKVDYGVLPLIPLTEELSAHGCAVTELLLVNAFSEKQEQAAAVAEFILNEEAEKVHLLTPHYSVWRDENRDELGEIVYRAYEEAVPMPHSMDAEDFLKDLRWEILKLF